MKGILMVVDDDDGSREAMASGLRKSGYEVLTFDSAQPALAYLQEGRPVDALITDVRMPGMDGYALTAAARRERPELAILMVTAFGDIDGAVQALKGGADDYLTKPVNLLELRRRVELQLERRVLARQTAELKERLDRYYSFAAIVGRSPAMQRVFERVKVVAPAPSTVLILGESGTGKELIANAIHQHSPRAGRRFVALNCGAIPGDILEAELFGHEKGAFTGAHQRRIGKIESAHGGTLFLDEISELSADLQVKLLRVLEQRVITRVGGNDEIPVDFRLIAATNRDLESEVREGRFRQDLYFRLKVVTVELPPLRERPEDIPLLVQHFVEHFNLQLGRNVKRVDASVIDVFRAYPWPGNVRELKNVVESMVLFARGEELSLQDVPAELRKAPSPAPASGSAAWVPRRMEDLEKEAILKTLEFTSGHRARAAELLGIGLRTLQRKIKEYKLKVPPAGRG
ncbi:MAG: sigma-54 dependent transcriptional regulator [Thermoanaerobaculum sp.]|nr:sigma-54 dependent transcriptional regulator [Thermoanaerobaculum sp.]MCX7895050.1 sigma-54 dependent transcriptional regulator [Thermoanaerobaculum sp.]MDW7966736.1 sigma-54 dependent transcriptional regulator [Thermoanaerobaculum sp.]